MFYTQPLFLVQSPILCLEQSCSRHKELIVLGTLALLDTRHTTCSRHFGDIVKSYEIIDKAVDKCSLEVSYNNEEIVNFS